MKTTKTKWMMLLTIIATAFAFSACGGDDDNNTPPAQPKVVSYQIDYSLEFPKEFT